MPASSAVPSSSAPGELSSLTRRSIRDMLYFVGSALLIGLAGSLVLMAAILFLAGNAYAQTPAGDDIQQGMLLLQEEGVGQIAAPLLDTEIHAELSGLLARIKVIQRFKNPGDVIREGIYAFPLPETAAVDHLDMKIGDRRIQGQIKEKEAARQIYEQAKQEEKKAALVEQWRPNLFTTRVAPIGADEEIVVELEYQQSLRYEQGTFSWRFPLAITPRYAPKEEKLAAESDSSLRNIPVRLDGWAHRPAVYPVRFNIVLMPGAPISEVRSAYHDIAMEALDAGRYRVTLKEGTVSADRDFELSWVPQTGQEPQAALFSEHYDGEDYFYLMLMPASELTVSSVRVPREITFIIDTSGSMQGASMQQAKNALQMALERLHPGDFFNVIEFNSVARALFTSPVAVSAATLDKARQFVSRLNADGGTEMYPALKAALEATPTPGMIGQVVFLTDGAVSNEESLFELIRERLHERRLFTVGIGSAPNAYFMNRAATFGRGTFTFIGNAHEAREKMVMLFQKLESPALTDIKVQWPLAVDMSPDAIGDLYEGEPVIIVAKASAMQGMLHVRGARQGRGWHNALSLGDAVPASGIAALWARREIDALLDEGRRNGNTDAARDAVVALALKHHLVSRFTSLVAVDVTPSVAAGSVIDKSVLTPAVPHGMEVSMAGLPASATSATWQALGGALALLLALLLGRRQVR